MIRPDGLLEHAAQLAAGPGRPREADLRRGISAAYYAVFHDLTGRAARHLAGSFPRETQNEIRRAWSHGEIARLAKHVVDRSNTLEREPDAPLPVSLKKYGRLLDIAATDADLVDSMRAFTQLQDSVTRPTTTTTPSSQSRTSSRHVKAPDSRASGSVMPGTKHARRCSR